MTEYTDNYGLNKYSDGDAANLRDQYNASMDIIDAQLKTSNDNAAYAKPILDAAGFTSTTEAGTSKARWDGAATLAAANKGNVTKINANLSALGADTVENATNLKAAIDANTSARAGKFVVVVGDSWTDLDDGDNAKWMSDPMNVLFEDNWRSYGVGGYTTSQVAELEFPKVLSDFKGKEGEVGTIIAICGVNDFRHTNTIDATFGRKLNDLTKNFPNAKCFWLVNCFEPRISDTMNQVKFDSWWQALRTLIINQECPIGFLGFIFNSPSHYLNGGSGDTSFHIRPDISTKFDKNWIQKSLFSQIVYSGTYSISNRLTFSNRLFEIALLNEANKTINASGLPSVVDFRIYETINPVNVVYSSNSTDIMPPYTLSSSPIAGDRMVIRLKDSASPSSDDCPMGNALLISCLNPKGFAWNGLFDAKNRVVFNFFSPDDAVESPSLARYFATGSTVTEPVAWALSQ